MKRSVDKHSLGHRRSGVPTRRRQRRVIAACPVQMQSVAMTDQPDTLRLAIEIIATLAYVKRTYAALRLNDLRTPPYKTSLRIKGSP